MRLRRSGLETAATTDSLARPSLLSLSLCLARSPPSPSRSLSRSSLRRVAPRTRAPFYGGSAGDAQARRRARPDNGTGFFQSLTSSKIREVYENLTKKVDVESPPRAARAPTRARAVHACRPRARARASGPPHPFLPLPFPPVYDTERGYIHLMDGAARLRRGRARPTNARAGGGGPATGPVHGSAAHAPPPGGGGVGGEPGPPPGSARASRARPLLLDERRLGPPRAVERSEADHPRVAGLRHT